jgi:hypothetical protein
VFSGGSENRAVLFAAPDGGTAAKRECDSLGLAKGRAIMEPFTLAVWLPALFLLGLAIMGLLFAFVLACDKV